MKLDNAIKAGTRVKVAIKVDGQWVRGWFNVRAIRGEGAYLIAQGLIAKVYSRNILQFKNA